MENTRVLLASRPKGWVTTDNFKLTKTDAAEVGDGTFLVENHYLSLDPYMRGRMNDVKSYVPPFEVGEVLQGHAVGTIVSSQHPKFAVGDTVSGMFGWESYSLSDGRGVQKVDPSLAPLPAYLSVLGMPGLTAYVGLLDVGQPKPGETVFVSAAAGAVGSVVGQIAKLKGCKVVGTAGSDEKVDYLKEELGFDAAFNYKSVSNLNKVFKELAPEGVDVNFENVGGDILETVLLHMNDFGRTVLCGMIAHYNDETPRPGPRTLPVIISKRLRLQGFIVSDHNERVPDFVSDMTGWLREGKIERRETISEGLESAPEAFINLLKGNKTGKQIVKIKDA